MYHNSGLLFSHKKPFTIKILSNLVLLNEGKGGYLCIHLLLAVHLTTKFGSF